MEATILPQTINTTAIGIASRVRRLTQKGRCDRIVVAVMARPAENLAVEIAEKFILKPAETKPQVVPKTSVQNDNWLELMAINHLSQSLQATTGLKNRKSGYESLVEATAMMSKKFDPTTQQELVIQALHTAIPNFILNTIKALLPQSQFTREYFAAFTTLFCTWLIGPSEVRESELNGRREKNVVHVKKCRFLEQSNCVGMCINLCKMPSQAFIKDSMGMPLNMIPNFDDMSCEMIFGQDPPASNDDPALKQPCYNLCRIKKRHTEKCSR